MMMRLRRIRCAETQRKPKDTSRDLPFGLFTVFQHCTYISSSVRSPHSVCSTICMASATMVHLLTSVWQIMRLPHQTIFSFHAVMVFHEALKRNSPQFAPYRQTVGSFDTQEAFLCEIEHGHKNQRDHTKWNINKKRKLSQLLQVPKKIYTGQVAHG